MIAQVGPSSRPAAAAAGGVEWVEFTPATATKRDPNTLEAAAPASLGGGVWRYTFDGQVAYLSPSDMLVYQAPLLDLDFGDPWALDVELAHSKPSDARVVAGFYVAADDALAVGMYAGLSQETPNTGTAYDHWSRTLATSVPAIGSATGPLRLRCTVRNGGDTAQRLEQSYMAYTYDGNTYRATDSTRSVSNAALTSGTKARIGVLVSARSVLSASEYADILLRYRVLSY
jgi:hypothetical protein